MNKLYSYFDAINQFIFKLYLFIIVFFAVWFWYVRSVYWDLMISEFFYNQNDIRVEISNIWLESFSWNIQINWLWAIISNDFYIGQDESILIWNSLTDIDVSIFSWKYLSWVWFVINSWDINISLITDWAPSDGVSIDTDRLQYIIDNKVSYQKVFNTSWVWIDWYATVRQNMTDIDTIANPFSLIQTWDIWTENTDDWLSFGDIEFTEIYASSGNCMNEFIKIRSNIYYSWLVSFYGLWSSSNTINYYLNLSPWQELLITDDISWLIPWSDILVWPTITLTNWWEQLKIIVSGVVLDDIIYSQLKWIQSLFYTENSGDIRIFQTNWPWTPANKCSQVNFTGWIWLCDIDLTTNYLWTGIYDIDLSIVWQYSNICNSWSIWIINSITWTTDSCTSNFQNLLGSNKIEFLQYSGTDLICKDSYIFASNYDIWYVNQYYCPVIPNTWSNNSSSSSPSWNQCIDTRQIMTDCHVKYQWSKVWFFADYNFNIVANIGWTDIQNNTKKYQCYRDMWDGNTLTECNPSGYKYSNPWVYTINLTITENSTSYYCKTSSFVNYPLKADIDKNYSNNFDLQNYISDFCDVYDDIDIIWSFCDGFYTSWFLQSNIVEQYDWPLDLIIYSVLPNPVWSDSLYEEVVLQNLLATNSILDWLILHIWSKKISLSWNIDWSGFKSIIWWLWLVNNGMCIYLKKDNLILDEFCYGSTKEWEIVTLSGQSMTWEDDSIEDDNDNLSWSELDIDIDKAWQEILDLLWLENVVWTIWDDVIIDKELNSLLTSVRLVQADYNICNNWLFPEHCKISTTKSSSSKSTSTMTKTQIDVIVYKHKYYLYKNFNTYLFNQISTWRPFVTEDPTIVWYYDDLLILDNNIWSWYIYTSKDNRSYRYFNNFKQVTSEENNLSLLEITYPWLADYLDEIKTYYINKELINNIKSLK